MFSSSWDPCDPQATTLFLWDRTEGACASTRTVGDAQTTADALPTWCGPVILKGVCLADKTKEAKNKIILFLCFMSFLFYFSEKERILQNRTKPPRLPLRHVWIGMGVVGSSPLAKRKGGVRIPRALWVEDLPAALSVSVLGFCQNNVSVQKYFCIFHLTTLLAFV